MLNEQQLVIMAAILGISNTGMYTTFLGPNAKWDPEAVKWYFKSTPKLLTVRDVVYAFGQDFFENEQMTDMFVKEAESWVDILKNMSIEKIKSTWRYGAFVDVITGE